MRFVRAFLVLCCTLAATTAAHAQGDICRQAGPLVPLAQLPEASGIAAADAARGPLLAINDSGRPLLTMLDRAGKVIHQVQIMGTEVDDWEDVSVARCGDGACVYVADIGDNRRNRRSVRVLRMPVPAVSAASVNAESFELAYPDGPHDAEAVFITHEGQLFLVTKEAKRAAVYRAPAPLRADGPAKLVHVGDIDADRVTDADTSPDGTWTAVRSNQELLFFRTADLVAARTRDPIRVSLRALKEPQGEGVTFGADGTVYLVGEGGRRNRPGTFTTLQCRLPGLAGGQ